MLRIAHIGDIHFRGLQRHDEYRQASEKMFEQMREADVHAIFVAGDIVHSKVQNITPELISILGWWFDELSKVAPTIVMLGNHDGLVYNPDRLDTVSPIIEGLKNPNIHFFPNTGTYPIELNGYDTHWHIYSPFDEQSGAWDKMRSVPLAEGVLHFAGFHGAINSAVTDVDWNLRSNINSDYFERYDFALLGDIHKYQTLDSAAPCGYGRVVYCGSMIQQNYGELPDKGWVLWSIKDRDTFKHEVIQIPTERPYLTFDWHGDPRKTISRGLRRAGIDEVPEYARVRLRADANVPPSALRATQDVLKACGHRGQVKLQSLVQEETYDATALHEHFDGEAASTIDLFDLDTYHSLYNAWLDDGGLLPCDIPKTTSEFSEEDAAKYRESMINSTIQTLRGPLDELRADNDRASNVRWSVQKIEWDNIFSYGEGNSLDLENTEDGTVIGIFGPNGIGKSTVVAVLMYTLFNTTDRGSMSNGEVLNDDSDWCEGRVLLTVNGRQLRVVRRTERSERKSRKSGGVSYSYKTDLKIHEKRGNLWAELTGEQRRDTDKVLREIIGSADDFQTVSLAPQGAALSFVESGGAGRRATLMRLLDLTMIEDLARKVKDLGTEDRTWLKRSKGSYELSAEIQAVEKETQDAETTIESLNETREQLEHELQGIQFNLDKDQHQRIDYLKKTLSRQEQDLVQSQERQERYMGHLAKWREKLDRVKEAMADIDIDDVSARISSLEVQQKSRRDIEQKLKDVNKELSAAQRLQKNIEGIPCGDQYPMCPYLKDAFAARPQIARLTSEKARYEGMLSDMSELKAIDAELDLLRRSHKQYVESEQEFYTISERLGETLADLDGAKKDTAKLQQQVDETASLIKELGDAISKGAEDDALVKKYESLKAQISATDSDISDTKTSIGVLNHRRQELYAKLGEARKAEERLKQWDSLQEFLSPKGVLRIVMERQLPVVNAFISRALGDTVDFSVRLHMPEDSKSLEVLLGWGDRWRSAETASGMQKLVAAIAIRTALHTVTPLPKSDLFIMDEGFGALDPDNLEGCFGMLDLYRRSYQHIMLISHLDAVKEAVDLALTVTVNQNGRSVLKHTK